MAGMRDKISHFYFGIDMKKVWLAVKRDIPKIKPQIRKILKDMSNEKKSSKKKKETFWGC